MARNTKPDCALVVQRAAAIGVTAAARELGISRGTASRIVNQHPRQPEPLLPIGEGVERDGSDETEAITVVSRTVRTLEQALTAAEVDIAVWEVDRYVVNKWDQGAKVRFGTTERIAVTALWQVKLWLKRRLPKQVVDAYDTLLARMKQHSPKYVPIKRVKVTDPHMLEVSVFDAHFGKLAWRRETGEDYDLTIAERLYRMAVEDLVQKAGGFPIEQVVFPVGSDFFHVDNLLGTTTAGTPQHCDGRWAKIFEAGQLAVINAIDYLRSVAPVKVIYVPGNHDQQTSWHLCHVLRAWYRNAKDVAVDLEPTTRKYVAYGANLIGFTHGDKEKHDRLPGLMALEVPELWAATRHREFHIGHFHTRRETKYGFLNTHDGVAIRTLPSLCAADAWHYQHGYVGSPRAADAFVWSKEFGLSGYFTSNARVPVAA